MVSNYYRTRLQQVLTSANDESIDSAATDWSANAALLRAVAVSIRASSSTLDSEIEGDTGRAMVGRFQQISDKLEIDSADMDKGSGALVVAHLGAIEAIKARNGIMLSGPMNQPPTKPEGPTPGTQATPEQEQALADYNAAVIKFDSNEQIMEDNAQAALLYMDQKYAEATLVMKEIHGEPDERPIDEPKQPTGPNGPGVYAPPPPFTGTQHHNGQPHFTLTNHGGEHTNHPQTTIYQPPNHHVDVTDCPGLPPTYTHPTEPVDHTTPTHTTPTHTTTTNVNGGTDSGTTYQGTGNSAGGTGTGASGSATGTHGAPSHTSGAHGAAGLGAGAAGAAGAAGLAASGLKGHAAVPHSAPGSGSVRGIGAGGRAGGPGSFGKAAGGHAAVGHSGSSRGASGSRAGAAGSVSKGATSAKGAASAGKGGGRGAAAGATGSKSNSKGGKGKGLFRRGSNGSVTGGRTSKKKDERSDQRDALVYEQDWLGDDSTAPGVLD